MARDDLRNPVAFGVKRASQRRCESPGSDDCNFRCLLSRGVRHGSLSCHTNGEGMLTYGFMLSSRTRNRRNKPSDFPKPRHAKILSRKIGYRGKVYTIVADKVREPKGVVALREIIRHHGS